MDMKKILLLAGLMIVVLLSCKKITTPTVVYQITATINGKDYVFNKNISFDTSFLSGDVEVDIAAFDKDSNQLYFNVETLDSLHTITYKDSLDGISELGFGFQKASGAEYIPLRGASNPFIITFISITKTSIAGTFEGTIYPIGSMGADTTQAPLIVTNGKFNVSQQ
jgi:hypothetical protein